MSEKKSIQEMKLFIRKYSDELTLDNKKSILQLLKSKIDNNKIKEVSDGIRIDLDVLNDNIIKELYSLVKYKLNEESSL